MIIEESVLVGAPLEKVWQTFIDLTCWADWNTVLSGVSSPKGSIEEGGSFRCCVRPYAFPIYFEPRVEEVQRHERIVWKGEKFGIRSWHEFLFLKRNGGTEIISRERFSGMLVGLAGPFFPKEKLRRLNVDFLNNLKDAAEAAQPAA